LLPSPPSTGERGARTASARMRGSAMTGPRILPLPETRCLTRRNFFRSVSGGVCGAALAYLLGRDLGTARADGPADLRPRPPHFPAKATSVIHLFMNGGPSQMDLFDPKPALDKHHGEPYVDKLPGEVEFLKDAGALMRSPFKFAR